MVARRMADCSIEIAGVRLANPLLAAAGTTGYGPELAEIFNVGYLGALTTKSITPESRIGNDPWRVVDLPSGMLNAIGLANIGLEGFLTEVVPQLAGLDTVVIGSIAGHTIEDYVTVAQALDAVEELPLLELNVSCPNTDTGRYFSDEPAALSELLCAVKSVLQKTPMIVKLSPGSADVPLLALTAVEAGADALCVGNTMPAMAVDPETGRSRIGRHAGGLSGPALHPVAARILHHVYEHLDESGRRVPLIATGGVSSWQDAAEFIVLGAHAVGIGTALMADPKVPKRILRGLERWVERRGGNLEALRGSFQR